MLLYDTFFHWIFFKNTHKKKNADVNFLLLAYLVEEPETFYLNYQEKDKCALIIRFFLNKQESDNMKKGSS